MYDIVFPLLAFEDCKKTHLEILDKNFTALTLDNERKVKIQLVNINYLNKLALNFDIDDEIIKKLKVENKEDFEIYFCLVIQNPIEDSIVNLMAPVLINHKEKILGQYLIKHRIPRLFSTIKNSVTL
jgi:flagellar assembly factor FliW